MTDVDGHALRKFLAWKMWFASWQVGTRPDDDAECSAIKDHREVTLALRAEVNALTDLLIEKGVFTVDEFSREVDASAAELDVAYEKRFPGVSAFSIEGGKHGLSMNPREALLTMRRMHFKE